MANYIGNNDYRGYLSYLAQNGDAKAGFLLNLVGNDGVLNPTELHSIVQTVGGEATPADQIFLGGTHNEAAATQAIKDYNAQMVAGFQGAGSGTGGGGGGGGTVYKNTRASQEATQKSIDSLDPALNNALAGITSNYERILADYAGENALNEKSYKDQTTSNERTRANNLQASLLAAAQGGRGMRATLASLGALDGTGQVLSNRAVASSANADIGAGNKVFDTNATILNDAWEKTKFDQKKRDEEAIAARANEKAAVRQEIARQRQSLYEKMAGYKAEAGDQAGADLYTRMMGELAPQTINPRPAVAQYNQRNIKYEAGQLGNYLGGRNDMTVKTTAGSAGGYPLNSPLYALAQKRDKELA